MRRFSELIQFRATPEMRVRLFEFARKHHTDVDSILRKAAAIILDGERPDRIREYFTSDNRLNGFCREEA